MDGASETRARRPVIARILPACGPLKRTSVRSTIALALVLSPRPRSPSPKQENVRLLQLRCNMLRFAQKRYKI